MKHQPQAFNPALTFSRGLPARTMVSFHTAPLARADAVSPQHRRQVRTIMQRWSLCVPRPAPSAEATQCKQDRRSSYRQRGADQAQHAAPHRHAGPRLHRSRVSSTAGHESRPARHRAPAMAAAANATPQRLASTACTAAATQTRAVRPRSPAPRSRESRARPALRAVRPPGGKCLGATP